MARKALGRGLDALIPEKEEPRSGGGGAGGGADSVIKVAIDRIRPGAFQPRQSFREESLAELAESIKTQGILQPLLVRPEKDGRYELIAGERRLRAAALAGLSEVPVLAREVDDRSALELSLVENIQREDLDPVEEAVAYRRLLTEFEYTQEELSRRVGKDRATISNLLRLLKLPEDIREDIRAGRVTAGHARAILMAGDESRMRKIRDAVVDDGISVREAENRARGVSGKKAARSPGAKAAAPRDIHLRQMEEELIRAMGTKVRVVSSGQKGQIEISFYSADELDRLFRLLAG